MRPADELIPVKAIDLMTVIVRIEQAGREGTIAHDASAAGRLVTCDAPRLRSYLPPHLLAWMEQTEEAVT
jgi:hypothetical protein